MPCRPPEFCLPVHVWVHEFVPHPCYRRSAGVWDTLSRSRPYESEIEPQASCQDTRAASLSQPKRPSGPSALPLLSRPEPSRLRHDRRDDTPAGSDDCSEAIRPPAVTRFCRLVSIKVLVVATARVLMTSRRTIRCRVQGSGPRSSPPERCALSCALADLVSAGSLRMHTTVNCPSGSRSPGPCGARTPVPKRHGSRNTHLHSYADVGICVPMPTSRLCRPGGARPLRGLVGGGGARILVGIITALRGRREASRSGDSGHAMRLLAGP